MPMAMNDIMHHVERALGPDHAAVEERKTRRHEQHECRARQDPGGIARVQDTLVG